MLLAALIIAVTLANAAAVAPTQLCGTWNATCTALPMAGGIVAGVRATWAFQGISVGTYTSLTQLWRDDAACGGNEGLRVAHTGSYQDTGPIAGDSVDAADADVAAAVPKRVRGMRLYNVQ